MIRMLVVEIRIAQSWTAVPVKKFQISAVVIVQSEEGLEVFDGTIGALMKRLLHLVEETKTIVHLLVFVLVRASWVLGSLIDLRCRSVVPLLAFAFCL